MVMISIIIAKLLELLYSIVNRVIDYIGIEHFYPGEIGGILWYL